MSHFSYFVLLITLLPVFIYQPSLGQTVIRREVRGVPQERRTMNEATKLFDKHTGKQVTYEEYQQLMKTDKDGYHLEPVFNEYGVASAYTIRATTAEERETHRFIERDPTQRPIVGEPMPEFVMKGIDDKVYRLSELKGHVVVLSFWISLTQPFWNAKQAKSFADALRPYQSETDPIVLGVLRESKEAIVNVMASETLPFIAIPNSYSFHQKFQVTQSPCLIVIDRSGKETQRPIWREERRSSNYRKPWKW